MLFIAQIDSKNIIKQEQIEIHILKQMTLALSHFVVVSKTWGKWSGSNGDSVDDSLLLCHVGIATYLENDCFDS